MHDRMGMETSGNVLVEWSILSIEPTQQNEHLIWSKNHALAAWNF